jgi:hypothetical protein
VAGDDWRGYRSLDELRAARRFWWFRREDVHRWVELVPDPLFGRAARVTFAASPETGFAPRMQARLPEPLERMWFRWRMRWSPGWTTVGPGPAGYANAYKLAFWLWEGYDGRGGIELTNVDQYVLVVAASREGRWLPYRKRILAGGGDFGRITTEWRDGQWWEFVVHYEKTGPETARQHWWRRRLTADGRVAPGPWVYAGVEISGAPTPRVRGVELGANKNRSTPAAMYIDWGPWEVVDGSRYPDPWGLHPPR